MRAKKRLTVVTFFITVLSILCYFLFDSNSDLFLAIFGSAFLGFTMSLIEHFSSRKAAMEKFYLEGIKLTKALYMDFDEESM